LDILRSDTSHTSLDPNSQSFTMSTLDTKPNNCVHNGLILLKRNNWFT
jgi:hypothetical protein